MEFLNLSSKNLIEILNFKADFVPMATTIFGNNKCIYRQTII